MALVEDEAISESNMVLNELFDATESDPDAGGFLTWTYMIGIQVKCYMKKLSLLGCIEVS